MYTDEDLNFAVQQGGFSEEAVDQFRTMLCEQKSAPSVDEENFRLISGFNDIFVVIACMLLLFSALWVVKSATDSETLGGLAFVSLSWCLAEFFVRKRKMALPAIVLLLSCIGGAFFSVMVFFGENSDVAIGAAAVSAIIAYLHWLRFRVPITVATGIAALVGLVIAIFMSVFPDAKHWLLPITFVCGLLTFFIAMYWDAVDTLRTTRHADVAFWLHLLSAPLIIHPVFTSLGVLEGNESILSMVSIIALYIVMTLISIAIDRRAFMVSSLVYVLYAIANLLEAYGDIAYSFALTGVLMGAMLLLLSAFWQRARALFVSCLPNTIKSYIPAV